MLMGEHVRRAESMRGETAGKTSAEKEKMFKNNNIVVTVKNSESFPEREEHEILTAVTGCVSSIAKQAR